MLYSVLADLIIRNSYRNPPLLFSDLTFEINRNSFGQLLPLSLPPSSLPQGLLSDFRAGSQAVNSLHREPCY